jgi:hypothetical protein
VDPDPESEIWGGGDYGPAGQRAERWDLRGARDEDPYGHYGLHSPAPYIGAPYGGGPYGSMDRRYPRGKTYSGGFYTGETQDDRPPEPHPRPYHPFPPGPKGYRRSDERIGKDIAERLSRYDYIDASEVELYVSGGHVKLEGTVPERGMKHAIEDLVEDCPGVREVENHIRVPRR